MIRMIQSSSAGHAKSYFSDALQKSDYYINDQELQGRFLGRLSNRIGITGPATKETFFALCENENPKTGQSLTPRNREDRTIGYDINFHCPKSVSLIHALSKDDHVLRAFQKSVEETMNDIEADSMTRVRKRGAYEDRNTRELAYAEFTHQTARPVDGSMPDPHLHSHCFVFNATWDDSEKVIKAGQFRDIKRDMPYYQARFHKKLSDNLIDLGYQIERTRKSFEIVGVPKQVIDLFSKRTNEIGEFAKEHGVHDPNTLAEIGARTRAQKQKGHNMNELKASWKQQIHDNIIYEPGQETNPIRHGLTRRNDRFVAADCIDHAVRHSFERASVIQDRRLLATAYRHSLGVRSVGLEGITDSFKKDSRFFHVKEKNKIMVTTKSNLAEEKTMIELAAAGQNKFAPLFKITPALDPKLDKGQAAAIEYILTTPHGVSIIRGSAGSGKTTLMIEAKKQINAAGKELFVVAPTAQASRGVLVTEGFENAETVAKLLQDKGLQENLKNQVLWIDEAGLLGIKETTALLKLAKDQNAKVIFGGDTRQHSSVVRGDALRILNTVGGIKTAEVIKIHRQKNVYYRAAVEDLSKGDVKGGFLKLTSIGAIKNVDPLKPNDLLIADYMNAVKSKKSALIVSPTHQQGDQVTAALRKELRDGGFIGKKEIKAIKLENVNLTEAEKSDWRNFSVGQKIQFNQNLPGIKRGSIWNVKEASEQKITINDTEDREQALPTLYSTAFDVFNETEISLSKGDKIRLTRNTFDVNQKRLNNGQYLEVAAISKRGYLQLTNKASRTSYELNKDFGHIAYAYCSTSHSAQGKTVDEVYISQPSATFTATDAKQFYVSVSRARDKVTVYTDDRDALLEYASDIGDRQSALELVNGNMNHMDYIHQFDRFEHTKNKIPSKQEPLLTRTDRDYEPGI